jgi:hypothetical protein
VTDSSHAPVAGICVYVTGISSYEAYGSAETASNGTYSVTGLEPGDYVVEFAPGCGSAVSYADQYSNGAPTRAEATPVVVSGGATTSSVNATMAAGGTITGTVKAGTKAVADVCVDAYLHGTSQMVSTGYSTANGSYSIVDLPAGSYDVEFEGSGYCETAGGDYATQWYANAASQAASKPVTVTAGSVTSGIAASLTKGGNVTGTVDMGTQPVANECVNAYQAGSSVSLANASTSAEGTYELMGLAAGSYSVEFGCSYGTDAVQWYSNAANQVTATKVAVTGGATTSGISANLVAGGSISGTVVNTSSSPMGGVCVSASDPGSASTVSTSVTSPDGTYTLQGLATSSYDVEFDPTCGGYPSDPGVQWYNGKASQATANAVSVTAGSTTTGIGDTLS